MDTITENIALLIDANNSPCKRIDFVLAELAKYGVVNEVISESVGATRGRTNRVMWKKGHIQACVQSLFPVSPGTASNGKV